MPRTWVVLIAGALYACGGGGDGPAANHEIVAVQITTATATLNPGETSQFTAVAVDAGGVAIPNAGTAEWASAGVNVATVDQTGLVRAVAPGSATIAATIGGITGSRLVTVLPQGAGAVVTMPGFSFVPFEVTIRVGQQVYFEFPAEPHNAIFARIAGAPQDIQETRNATVPRRFTVAGRFAYDCTLHPGMSGVVIVNP